ncbi:LOW QUALITY PROTEIN: N-alpha-acetyltransferase 25, NatB auxiliary subunit [Bacillus rossius redtenbacheri]|uniref:LOW QUALITY PROTEIN: N-alpha-acetyltransferase 25, NatB auxiliary subunit n=1 Tax=Bacillus rossius redtenbacheri TaxID=93214 RepID=UPI002FDF06D3
MATKVSVHNTVVERRLRPIYDWLDNGNNKKALQEADKVLKKQPQSQCAKVLKALALLRLGKEDECAALLESVRAESPVNEATLQAMTICYKEMHKPDKICSVYEAAVKQEPCSEELLTHLFMAYVRVGDYKRQQQAALAVYKLCPKNPYYFWAVMSVVMQAHEADARLARTVVLPLAERMVRRFADDGKMEAEQEVLLYLMILTTQDKYQEALDVLEGPLGEKLVSYVFVPVKKGSLLMKLGRWRDANVLFKSLLRSDMDGWAYYRDYFTSALELWGAGAGDRDEAGEADCSPEMCRAFLRELQAANERLERRLRGPYLAQLELFKRLRERGQDPESLLGSVVDLLMSYFAQFGCKPCCVSDLRPFLPLLSAAQSHGFLELVRAQAGDAEPQSVRELQTHVSSVQLQRCVGHHAEMSVPDKRALAARLAARYRSGLDLGTAAQSTEFLCCDPYALLTAQLLSDLWGDTGDSSYLVQAAALLEQALALSPANYYAKLQLLRLYLLLGGGEAAVGVYDSLDVKHMQLDSLGWLLCAHIVETGVLSCTGAIYDSTLKFFSNNYKDGVDHLTYSYKFGSFMKLHEFIQFQERLNNSLHYATVTVDKMLLEVLSAPSHAHTLQVVSDMELCPEEDATAWDKLRDNRDLMVGCCWEPPPGQVTEQVKADSFAEGMSYLRLRTLLLRCVGAAVALARPARPRPRRGVNGEQRESGGAVLASVAEELCVLGEAQAASTPQPRPPQSVLSAPLPCRLRAGTCCRVVVRLARLLCAALADGEEQDPASRQDADGVRQLVEAAVSELAGRAQAVLAGGVPSLARRRTLLQDVTATTEVLGPRTLTLQLNTYIPVHRMYISGVFFVMKMVFFTFIQWMSVIYTALGD